MKPETALLTFSIGPVHSFIAQARRVADLWAGSDLLSYLISEAIQALPDDGVCAMVFPYVARDRKIPPGLPNRFVCRVPRAKAQEIAQQLEAAVRTEWDRLVRQTVEVLTSAPFGFEISEHIWHDPPSEARRRQTDTLLDVAWSWVPEDAGYAAASLAGAEQFIAARRFRPFPQIEERGEKCAVCGERTALPDGDRHHVRERWAAAEAAAETVGDWGFFRLDQTRLCLVCATKRLYPKHVKRKASFNAFDRFEPEKEEKAEDRDPYFAIVAMDGDRMGDILGWQEDAVASGDVEAFHREVSKILTGFAEALRSPHGRDLNLGALGGHVCKGAPPQLIYAGGEDVLFVADARDALPLARAIRQLYRQRFEVVIPRLADPARYRDFTISAGILYAHTKHPAGLLFRDVEALLKQVAKGRAGRDAVALRLVKRGGVPTQVAFKWEASDTTEIGWLERLERIIELVRKEDLASRQTFNLRTEESTLTEVLHGREQWQAWLTDRLSRAEASTETAAHLAAELAPFFEQRATEALRIARFLGREVPR